MGKPKMKVDDVGKAKRRYKKSTLQKVETPNPQDRHSQLAPIPPEAFNDPVKYARDHTRSMIPYSAKELEWQLKFGDARTRKEIAMFNMASEGISDKGPQQGQVVPAINLILSGNGLPWNQTPVLDATNKTATVEGVVVERETVEKK